MARTILDILLDDKNTDPVELYNEDGEKFVFDQIAVVPHNGKTYCVLKPITKMENVADDEAIVFRVDELEDEIPVLSVENDEKIADIIFERYYKLLEEAEANKKKTDKKNKASK